MSKEPTSDKQISADQILQDAYDHKDSPVKHSNYKINDIEELKDYQLKIRTSYEKALQFKRTDLPQYIRYAKWEWDLQNFNRARSILERGINVDHSNVKLWSQYINLEISNGNLNHARNLLERVITLLPRVDKFYYEYIQLEEKLGEFGNVQEIFQRWLNWKPKTNIYDNYIRFLVKYKDFDKCRIIYEQLIRTIPTEENFLKYINFEWKHGTAFSVRNLIDLIIENLIKIDKLYDSILLKYLDFEISLKNFNKVRQIYKFGLTSSRSDVIYEAFTNFEKQYGSKIDIEQSVLIKRKLQYEKKANDYQDWWSYLDIVEELNELSLESFEKCLSMGVPHTIDNVYILIWLRFLYFEELQLKDFTKTRELYKELIKIIGSPQNEDMYIKFANFEIRQGNLQQARKIYGYCLGKYQGKNVVTNYIDLEKSLRQFDRVRKIFESYLGKNPNDVEIWLKFIEFELKLDELDRVEAIYQIVLAKFPQDYKLYKNYLEFLHQLMNYEKTRVVYQELIDKSHNVNIYISYLMNELLIPTMEQMAKIENGEIEEFEVTIDQILKLEKIYIQGLKYYKEQGDVDNRVVLYESFKNFIKNYIPDKFDDVVAKGPKLVKRYIDNDEKLLFVFNDDDDGDNGGSGVKTSSFLENAKKWMLQQEN